MALMTADYNGNTRPKGDFLMIVKPINLFRIFLILAIPLSAGVNHAAVYYLSTTGSDSNSCSQAQSESTPKKTINNAITCLSAGSTLLIKNGTYITQTQLPGIPSGTSWASPVTIAAYPGHSPVLQPQTNNYTIIQFENNQQYIILSGLIFDGAGKSDNGIKITYGSDPATTAHHIRIINNEIKNSAGQGVYIGTGNYGGGNELLNNKIHNNGSSSFDHGAYVTGSNTLIEHNEVYNNSWLRTAPLR